MNYYSCSLGAQLVEALHYNPEGRELDSHWFIGIFHWHNPSGRTLVLGSSQPLTEMSTRNISWGKGGRCVGLTTLPPSCADCLKVWEPRPPGTLKGCNWICLLKYFDTLNIPGFIWCKYIPKDQKKLLWIYGSNFIVQLSPTRSASHMTIFRVARTRMQI
jgi:hypothetical protein